MCNGGDGAYKSFRVNWTFRIQMVAADKVVVGYGEPIYLGILYITVSCNENGGIYGEQKQCEYVHPAMG